MHRWFKPVMVILAGMLLLLLGDAPRHANQQWRNALADPMTLRLFGAVVIGIGVYWGIVLHASATTPKRRKR
jgi:hypothetical protein